MKGFHDIDWDDSAAETAWTETYDITIQQLLSWQERIRQGEVSMDVTPSGPSPSDTIGSVWSQESLSKQADDDFQVGETGTLRSGVGRFQAVDSQLAPQDTFTSGVESAADSMGKGIRVIFPDSPG